MNIFLGKKRDIKWIKLLPEAKKFILDEFLGFFPQTRIFLKKSTSSAFDP